MVQSISTRRPYQADFIVPAVYKVEIKERELVKLWNIRVRIILIVDVCFFYGIQRLEIRGRIKTIQTTGLLI